MANIQEVAGEVRPAATAQGSFPVSTGFEILETRYAPATIVWTGVDASDPKVLNPNWSDGKNWQGGVPPGLGDNVQFPTSTAARTSVVDAGFEKGLKVKSIGSLKSDWDRTIVLNVSLTVSNRLNFVHGTIDGPGDLVLQGILNLWKTGNMRGKGTTKLDPGAGLIIGTTKPEPGSVRSLDGRTLEIDADATVKWVNGDLDVRNGAVIANKGVFTSESRATHKLLSGAKVPGRFDNSGEFKLNGTVIASIPFTDNCAARLSFSQL